MSDKGRQTGTARAERPRITDGSPSSATCLRHFLIFSENAAVAAGLSAQQHQALLAIKAASTKTPVTAGLLAERLGTRHHSAVGLLDRLAGKSTHPTAEK